jgi:protein-disulfide isomerase
LNSKGNERRENAAKAKEQAQKEEQRRQRRVMLIGGVVVAIVALGIIGMAVFAKSSDSNAGVTVSASVNPSAKLPTGTLPAGDPYEYGIVANAAPPAAGVPTLEMWEDFQCPACGRLEAANGAGITKLADDGKIKLIYRMATFLDFNLKNDASARATMALGCAVDAGKGLEYRATVFKNQPVKEGEGYTDQQLLDFGKQAGISGPAYDTFTKCVNDQTYLDWVSNTSATFTAKAIQSTPAGLLNGTLLDGAVLADPTQLGQAVAAASAKP